jgi:hypothetical protein
MDWTAILMIAGFCVCVAGLIFCARSWLRGPIVSGNVHVRTSQRLESAGELWGQAALWGGIVLVLAGNIAQEIRSCASPQMLAFGMSATAGNVLVLGICLGRLSMRRQLQPEAETQAELHDAGSHA